MSDFAVSINNKEFTWSEEAVKSKLQKIGKLNGKRVAWIQSDLSVKKSNWLTRVIWSVVAKHFSWMRKHFYGVDLNQSRSLLVQLGNQIQNNPNIKDLYHQAVGKFNQIAPGHKVAVEGESIPLHSIGNVEEKSPLPDPNLKVFGKEAWKEYYHFEVDGEIPPLPEEIGQIVNDLRTRLKGEKEAPTFSLLLMPKGLTLNQLKDLVQNPAKGNSTQFNIGSWSKIFKELGDKPIENSYWILMTNDVIEGSRNKSYADQVKVVEEKAGSEWQVPKLLEAAVCSFMNHVSSGEEKTYLFGQKPWTFTRCQEKISGWQEEKNYANI